MKPSGEWHPHVKRMPCLWWLQILLDVGVAIASDNVSSVRVDGGEQLIYKPSAAQLADWNGDRTKRFNTLIVQPYVLVQEPRVGRTRPCPRYTSLIMFNR